MAIITVNLPEIGPLDTVRGPLAALYRQQYDVAQLHYPKNLGSIGRGHSVHFTIKKIKELTLDEVAQTVTNVFSPSYDAADPVKFEDSSLLDKAKKAGEDVINGAKASIDANGIVGSLIGGARKLGTWTGTQLQTALKQRTEIAGHIELYMPETLNFTYNAGYNSLSLMEAAASIPLVGRIASGIQSVMQNDAAKLVLNRAGYVFNPQQQLLFEGIDFRTYQMAFTFSPVSQEEANTVDQIIREFRRYAAPVTVREAAGMFYVPPAIFEIQFKFNGKENSKINKIEQSVIESIDVNYAPNGWAAHTDGAPVQTVVTISFREIVLIDREKIEQGY